MNLADIVLATSPVADAFEMLGVAYYIGGSVASSTYGIARATLDVDLVADLSQHHVTPLMQWLKDTYYIDEPMIRTAIQSRGCFNVVHLETMMKLDVYLLQDRPFAQKSFERRKLDSLEDTQDARVFYIGSPEDILLHKLEWFRLGGNISERQWGDILGILKVRAKIIDLPYLSAWAKQIGVNDLLEKALQDAGIK
jgi:hypothetical protein